MPGINEIIGRWWKQMLAVILLSTILVGVLTYMKPDEYLSVATAVPASSYSSDKSKVFNDNIQELYSALGTTEDLDMIIGTAQLDTIYLAVTDSLHLFDYYKMKETGDAARSKAANCLQKNTRVIKSDYGELKVKVWDRNAGKAAQMANAIMNKIQEIQSNIAGSGNRTLLHTLADEYAATQTALDTLRNRKMELTNGDAAAFQQEETGLIEKLDQYKKLIPQYQLMVDHHPQVLIIAENARPSSWPDRPRRMQIIIATFVLSLVFAFLAALVFDSRKNSTRG